jgi:hypothetical protein
MKTLLIISLLFSFSFLFGQFGGIQKISYVHGTVTAGLNVDYGKWQQAPDIIYIAPQGFRFKTSEYTEYEYHNSMMEPYTSKEFLIMEHSKEYCDIRIEELEKQIEELRQIILNINE